MNADFLIRHYERISDAPDATARLRRFILHLAVRGKLVPQHSVDDPASELLNRLTRERLRLVDSGVLKKNKQVSLILDQEVPFHLPENWVWARLHQIGSLSGGMTPSMGRSDFWDGEIVWLSPKDIKADQLFTSELKITEKGLSETRLNLYRPGSLFMVARSGILKRTFPVSINRVPAAANQDLKVLAPFIDGVERYLQVMFFGLSDFILVNLVKNGTTVQSLKYDEFEEQPFPLPPLGEQNRIVAKVDELMALCDQLEAARAEREAARDRLAAASLARLNTPDPEHFQDHVRFTLDTLPALTARPDQIKQLRQTILNLAVRGKLVPQHKSDESAQKLFEKLSQVNRFKAQKCEFDSDLLAHLPMGWVWIKFGALIIKSDAGWSPKTENFPRTGEEWGVLKVSAVSWHQFRPLENKQLLPGVSPRLQAQIKKDDFLISRANTAELVARAVIVDREPDKLMMSDKIVRLELVKECNPRFILVVNNYADFARAHYVRHASGVSPSMKNISRDVIMEMPFPLAPLAEQNRIVAKVDKLMTLCDQLEQNLTTMDATRCRLLEALLADALVPARAKVLEAAE